MKENKKPVKRDDSEVLQKILERLKSIDPPVKKIAVGSPDPSMALYLLSLDMVCYITTRSDAGRGETALLTSDGKTFYTNLGLSEVGKKLANHPHFLQTSKFYIVNLTKIRGIKTTSSRDLWFDGIEKPLVNGVTSTFLAEFEKRMW
jgi:DNA-binding LytR/AlgR family response regulator